MYLTHTSTYLMLLKDSSMSAKFAYITLYRKIGQYSINFQKFDTKNTQNMILNQKRTRG